MLRNVSMLHVRSDALIWVRVGSTDVTVPNLAGTLASGFRRCFVEYVVRWISDNYTR